MGRRGLGSGLAPEGLPRPGLAGGAGSRRAPCAPLSRLRGPGVPPPPLASPSCGAGGPGARRRSRGCPPPSGRSGPGAARCEWSSSPAEAKSYRCPQQGLGFRRRPPVAAPGSAAALWRVRTSSTPSASTPTMTTIPGRGRVGVAAGPAPSVRLGPPRGGSARPPRSDAALLAPRRPPLGVASEVAAHRRGRRPRRPGVAGDLGCRPMPQP